MKQYICLMGHNTQEEQLLKDYAKPFEEAFHFTVLTNPADFKEDSYDGVIITTDSLKTSLPVMILSLEDGAIGFAKALTQLQAACFQRRLEQLPFHLNINRADGLVLTNHAPRDYDGFEEALTDDYCSPEWVRERFVSEDKTALHTTIATPFFEAKPIQSYYKLSNEETLEIVQDINPLLETYLEDSAQALVGWSDTTSGASISLDD